MPYAESCAGMARGEAITPRSRSRRLDALLKNIVQFSRPAEESVAAADLTEVVRQTASLMRIGCRERNITLTVEEESGVPKVNGSPDMLKQCLINLIKNAMEALVDGGHIHVRSTFSDGVVRLEIKDDGPGIPIEEQSRVFLPFFSAKRDGSGLGLAITSKAVFEMGGDIRLHSELGQGTLFSLTLTPALAANTDKSPATNSSMM